MKEGIAAKLDSYNTDIAKAAEYNGRMAANMINNVTHINGRIIQSLVRASFMLGATYQKNISENKPNIIE